MSRLIGYVTLIFLFFLHFRWRLNAIFLRFSLPFPPLFAVSSCPLSGCGDTKETAHKVTLFVFASLCLHAWYCSHSSLSALKFMFVFRCLYSHSCFSPVHTHKQCVPCMCMCVLCMCICVWVLVCARVCACVCLSRYLCVRVCTPRHCSRPGMYVFVMHVCLRICATIFRCTCVTVNICMNTSAIVCVCVMCMCSYMCACIHVCVRACIRACKSVCISVCISV